MLKLILLRCQGCVTENWCLPSPLKVPLLEADVFEHGILFSLSDGVCDVLLLDLLKLSAPDFWFWLRPRCSSCALAAGIARCRARADV
jgi:hypothetical protein